jgi:class 3 adenylate cyclase
VKYSPSINACCASRSSATVGRKWILRGDSFFVAFTRATDAVLAAVDAQRALATHVWPDGAELRVRMGLHTGSAMLRDNRFVGMAVHRAARICTAGHGGQILLSETTRNLLEDEEEEVPSVALRDLTFVSLDGRSMS